LSFAWQLVFLALLPAAVVIIVDVIFLQGEARFNIVIALATSLLGAGLAGWWAERVISAPIKRLGEAVDRLSADEDGRVQITGAAEIRRLQHGFNRAAATLADSRQLLQMRIGEAVAELARKNQQLELASQAKMQLLAAASHDLRQPLYAIALFSEGLANGETDPTRLQRISYIRQCVESLNRLFSELLNLAQLDAGTLRPQWTEFPLDRLFGELDRTFRPVAEQRNLRLVMRKTDVWVRCDYVMLSRILGNLISNSLRHTYVGGVLVGARRREHAIRIDVVDTGIGIAPEHQQRVFEEFYQIEPQRSDNAVHGMGLGLAIVQRLTGLLSSHIELTSVPNKGTCVHLTVRAVEAMQSRYWRQEPANGKEPDLAGLQTLVIDDEHTILEGLQLVLSSWGMQVLTAQTRAEALALADTWQRPPDVILTDLLLRNGDSGVDLLAALEQHSRGTGAHTVRLLVTGETQPERLRQATGMGITVLYKPVSPRALRQAIAAQLAAMRG
jgi:signal transduction histidine kinase